ncbi:FAD-binding protein [Actinokineospora guangxiensis]|uniref:FAD-binding protein n=1 Tax=Actinokineospora guangxiensis TaxID=1490288 RepID=A0ABW0ER11_9PSEU
MRHGEADRVVTVRSAREAEAVVAHAAARSIPVRVHTTGHAHAAQRPPGDALLVRTAIQEPVTIDEDRLMARAPAGALWREVVTKAARHGLAAVHPAAPAVGVVGYLTRGGVGAHGRARGLASNTVSAFDVVGPDALTRRVDADTDADLLDALRGGGGGFGVVTAVEFGLFPLRSVVTGAAYWPLENAHQLLTLWRDWAVDAPRQATTSVRVLSGEAVPWTEDPVVCVTGAVLGGSSAMGDAEDLLGPLRAVATPLRDTWRSDGPAAPLFAAEHPVGPARTVGDHLLLDEIGRDGVAEFLRVLGEGSGSPLPVAELHHLGGALAERAPAGGLLDHLDAGFAYTAFGATADAASAEHLAVVRRALSPWDVGTTVPSMVASRTQPQGHLDRRRAALAAEVRARVDPDGVFAGDVAPVTPGSPG